MSAIPGILESLEFLEFGILGILGFTIGIVIYLNYEKVLSFVPVA